MGCDSVHPTQKPTELLISIHAPIVGCDHAYYSVYVVIKKFQSTHPSWGATKSRWIKRAKNTDFNPRSHRGVRRGCDNKEVMENAFQSTHPSWGATWSTDHVPFRDKFQSTHPSWGATVYLSASVRHSLISIHAPIVGCD